MCLNWRLESSVTPILLCARHLIFLSYRDRFRPLHQQIPPRGADDLGVVLPIRDWGKGLLRHRGFSVVSSSSFVGMLEISLCPACFSTVFILCFPNKQDSSYQNNPTATLYRTPHLKSAQHQLTLGGRGVRPCLKSPPSPCKQWGEPGSQPCTASVIGTEQTQPSADGQGPHKKPIRTYLQCY